MSIGTGVVLFVVGAIITFALNFETEVVNLDLIGYILMGAGLITFVIGLVLQFRRRATVSTVHHESDPATGDRTTRRVTEADEPAAR